MIRHVGVVVVASLLPLGCDGAPTSPDPVPVPGEESAVEAPRPVQTVERSLSDPFVVGLTTDLSDRAASARLDLSLRAVRVKAGAGRATETRIALAEAIGVLHAIDLGDPDDDIAVAVLALVLRDLLDGTAIRSDLTEGGP